MYGDFFVAPEGINIVLSNKINWYLVNAKPRQDDTAERNLVRQGYCCYRPLLVVERIEKGKISERPESMFPGYLFILLSDDENWVPIRSTLGVKGLVSFGERPARVPEPVIDSIRGRTANVETRRQFQLGDRVIVTDGPFSGIDAIFKCHDGNERVILLFNFLQSERSLRVPLGAVRKLA